MENEVTVSVIIPAYNRADFIDQSIGSVLYQTHRNIELIVVDDGSLDGTYEKIKSYGTKLIILSHEGHANRGQSASINLGMTRATGKYIAILDSDDYWEMNKLEVQVDYLEKHSDIGLVYSNGYAVDAQGNVLYPIYPRDHVEYNNPNKILLNCYIALPVNSLVRREVYEHIGQFKESYRAAQDHDMLIRIAEVTKLAYISDYLWYYRRHSNSISTYGQKTRWLNGFKILMEAKSRYPYLPSTIRKRIAVLNYRLGQYYWNNESKLKGCPYLIKAGIYDPCRAIKVLFGNLNRK